MPQTACVTVPLPVGTPVVVVGHVFADGAGTIEEVHVDRVSYGQPSLLGNAPPVPLPTASKRATTGVPACLPVAICVQCHVCAVCASGLCATTFTQVPREGHHPGWDSYGRVHRREAPAAAARATGHRAACPVGGLHRRPVDGRRFEPLVAATTATCGHGWRFVRTATGAVIMGGWAVAAADLRAVELGLICVDLGASALRLLTALP